jgi:hypothetical protein
MSTERPRSGYYYPNKMGRIFLTALEDVMGRNGLNALLRQAGLEHYTARGHQLRFFVHTKTPDLA